MMKTSDLKQRDSECLSSERDQSVKLQRRRYIFEQVMKRKELYSGMSLIPFFRFEFTLYVISFSKDAAMIY